MPTVVKSMPSIRHIELSLITPIHIGHTDSPKSNAPTLADILLSASNKKMQKAAV